MEISGIAAGVSFDVAMVKKVQQATEEQGQQALQLIEQAGAAPVASPTTDADGRLHIVA